MNKFIKISIIAGAIILGASSISLATFNDMPTNEHYYTAIETLVKNGIINGYPDNTFRPSGKITRAEFAKMICVAENLTLNTENEVSFEDAVNIWATQYIELAASNNLIKGYEDKTFKPSNEITYGEVATILLRTLEMYDVTEDNSNWPENCMKRAEEIGLFDGIATNDLIAVNTARRDNVALMIWNKLEYEKSLASENEEKDPSGDKENINKDDQNKDTSIKIDTKKVYLGTVEKINQRRGEYYITLKDFDNNELEIKLDEDSKLPDLHTLLLYKLSKDGDVSLKKKLTVAELDTNYLLVEDVDNELIKLKDTEELFDLEKDTFEYLGEKLKLNKYDFYFAEMLENDNNNYEFANVEEVKKEELKVKKEDRIIFDSEAKMVFVVRGIEEQ